MELYVDLHVHSALSPCANDDMTPGNILSMAYIKGLDAIAITDHNCGLNLEAASKWAELRGIILVPGMEVQTQEEFHSICLFRNLDDLRVFNDYIQKNMPIMKNSAEIFGKQLLVDDEDNIIGEHENMLLNSVLLSIDQVYGKVEELDGVIIPAHVDRDSYSIINSLGFIPENFNIKTIEVRDMEKFNAGIRPLMRKDYNIIVSSDAHKLEDILERVFKIEVAEKSLNGIINSLKGK